MQGSFLFWNDLIWKREVAENQVSLFQLCNVAMFMIVHKRNKSNLATDQRENRKNVRILLNFLQPDLLDLIL